MVNCSITTIICIIDLTAMVCSLLIYDFMNRSVWHKLHFRFSFSDLDVNFIADEKFFCAWDLFVDIGNVKYAFFY